jgi:hypothetical protein
MNPLSYFSRSPNSWFNAGSVSSFPNIDPEVDSADLSQPRESKCEGGPPRVPGCKVFSISREDGARGKEVTVQSGALEWDEDDENKEDLKDQVMIFRYRGKFFAVDHVRSLLELCSLPCNRFVAVDADRSW